MYFFSSIQFYVPWLSFISFIAVSDCQYEYFSHRLNGDENEKQQEKHIFKNWVWDTKRIHAVNWKQGNIRYYRLNSIDFPFSF